MCLSSDNNQMKFSEFSFSCALQETRSGIMVKILFLLFISKGVERTIQEGKLKMNALVKIFIMMALLPSTVNSGLLAYGICQTGCNTVWVACVSGAGGVAGVSTGGAAVPAAILACNAAQGVCMAPCVAAGVSPTP